MYDSDLIVKPDPTALFMFAHDFQPLRANHHFKFKVTVYL